MNQKNPSSALEAEKSNVEWGGQQAKGLWDNLYAKHVSTVNGKVVLDLGCSWGYMLMFLHRIMSHTPGS